MHAGRQLLVLVLLLLAHPPGVASAESAVPIVTGDYPPYTSAELAGGGVTAQLVRAACAAAGIDTELTFYPWKRAEVLVERGRAFATFPYLKTAEREKRFLFSAPLYRADIVVTFNAGNPRTPQALAYTGPADLEPYRVGIVRASYAERPLRSAGVTITELNGVEQGLAMLLASRIDFFIADQAAIDYIVRVRYGDRTAAIRTLAGRFAAAEPHYLMVSREYPGARELLERFDRGLASLRRDGQYERLTHSLLQPP